MEQLTLNIDGIQTMMLTDRQTDRPPQTLAEKIEKSKTALRLAAEMSKTYVVRYCCEALKETSTPNRLCALGVRASESRKRQGRDTFSTRGGHIQRRNIFFT